MGAVLNVVGRPELLCCGEVLPIEEGLERFEDKCLISLGCRFAHFGSPWLCRQRFSLSAGLAIRLRSCSRSCGKNAISKMNAPSTNLLGIRRRDCKHLKAIEPHKRLWHPYDRSRGSSR